MSGDPSREPVTRTAARNRTTLLPLNSRRDKTNNDYVLLEKCQRRGVESAAARHTVNNGGRRVKIFLGRRGNTGNAETLA
jgi:hypothetical protein